MEQSAMLSQLRQDVSHCLTSRRALASAEFLAMKLVSLTNLPEDAFLLAKALAAANQPHRAVAILTKHGLLQVPKPNSLDAVLLATQCLLATAKTEDAMACLQSVLGDATNLDELRRFPPKDHSILAMLCYERGRGYGIQENRALALLNLRVAIHLDPSCVEAMDAIIAAQMRPSELTELLHSLKISGAYTQRPWMEPILHAAFGQGTEQQKFGDSLLAIRANGSLMDDDDIKAWRAETRLNNRNVKGAFELTTQIYNHDPHHRRGALAHIAAMVEQGKTIDLFYFAHCQVKDHPTRALSWYAVGAYYYASHKYEQARKYFHKAVVMDPMVLQYALAFGHAHALHDESDRALAVYRSASRTFPGNPHPLIGTAMEYLRTNNVVLAEKFVLLALESPQSNVDPMVLNELGVILYRQRKYAQAVDVLRQALQAEEKCGSGVSAHALINLGHALRRDGRLEEAELVFNSAVSLAPRNASAYSALGLTLYLNGKLDRAVDFFHKALSLKTDDAIVTELLSMILKEMAMSSSVLV